MVDEAHRIHVVGTVGIPACYGGFETLVESLVLHSQHPEQYTIVCSSKKYTEKPACFQGARLRYIALPPNGPFSVLYDIAGIVQAVRSSADAILVLGVSGAIVFPLIRMFSKSTIICNIDGMEWKRAKWGWLARIYLKFSESMAIKHAHEVIADSRVIAEYVQTRYGIEVHTIAYGGTPLPTAVTAPHATMDTPSALTSSALMICRVEPENHVDLILASFHAAHRRIIAVGNWNDSKYGIRLRTKYQDHDSITMLDSTYDPGELTRLRSACSLYIHGHSAGGTNPSLVEAMHAAKPILCFDCDYNRETTEGEAIYFQDQAQLTQLIVKNWSQFHPHGTVMHEIAIRRYSWPSIVDQYEQLFGARSHT